MRVAITGASGLIGTALTRALRADGITVHPLVRGVARDEHEITWSPADGTIDAAKLIGVDAVVHLAAESILGLRWTEDKRRRIRESRVRGTGLIARTLAGLDDGPRIFVSVSAIGYYGDTEEEVDETAPRGGGFLAEVCEEWERAADPARAAGLRVVHPRIGLVLSGDGGLLGPMLPAFKMGVGGPVGSGRQWFSWVSIVDVVRALRFVLEAPLEGPVNVVAPNAVRHEEFVRALGRVLHRPTVFRLPAAAVRMAVGQMGEETLLQGQHVLPRRLTEAGFEFAFADVEAALRHELG